MVCLWQLAQLWHLERQRLLFIWLRQLQMFWQAGVCILLRESCKPVGPRLGMLLSEQQSYCLSNKNHQPMGSDKRTFPMEKANHR